jgi:hypothetical protein
MSWLKIKLLKSEFFHMGANNEVTSFCVQMLNCHVGTLFVKSLRVPLNFLILEVWIGDFLNGKMIKKLDSWIANSASSGG